MPKTQGLPNSAVRSFSLSASELGPASKAKKRQQDWDEPRRRRGLTFCLLTETSPTNREATGPSLPMLQVVPGPKPQVGRQDRFLCGPCQTDHLAAQLGKSKKRTKKKRAALKAFQVVGTSPRPLNQFAQKLRLPTELFRTFRASLQSSLGSGHWQNCPSGTR